MALDANRSADTQSTGRRLASNAALLFSASVASQLLSFGGLLVVARLYAPEQVGSLAVIVALGLVVSIIASGRFDLAAVTEPTDERATIYVKLVAGLTLLTAIVTMIG